MSRINGLAWALGLAVAMATTALAYVAIVNKTDYQEMHIVPAPGKVVIDGDLKDWDLSGAVTLCLDEASRSAMNIQGAYMYDQGAFYVGGHVKDPTPMVNAHDFASDMSLVWDADAVQLRLISNPAVKSKASLQSGGHMSPEDQRYVCHFDLWYSTRDQKPGFLIRYTLHFKDANLNPPEVQAAYRKDADGKGYTFEYRVPWKLLRLDKPWKDGDTVQTQWQVHWGDDRGERVKAGLTDVRNKESGDLGYMGPSSWGLGIVHGKGNLKLAKRERVTRPAGHIPIEFTLTKATKVSLAVTDRDGRIVRTCLGAEPFEAGKQTYFWDGLDDYDRPVPAGGYWWRLLTQDGFEQRYVCDVGVSGNPPYQNDAGTGGWAGDYGFPVCVDADDDLVVLGTGSGEAAPFTIGVSLEGQKLWGGFWGDKGCWTLHKGIGYYTTWGGHLCRFDAREGKLKAFANGQSQIPLMDEKDPNHAKRKAAWGGMTVVDGLLAIVNNFDSALYLVDRETGAVKEKLPLGAHPYGAATGPKGELYVFADGRIGRYDLEARSLTPLTDALPETKMLDCDAAGSIYAAVWGNAMQVWKFSPTGKLLQKFGKEGGRPAQGKFDPAGMYKPYDVAVDKNGRVWVAELDDQPKRYSVWNPDGTLWKDFFGSHVYSSGAYVNPAKPEEIYVMPNVRYRIDYNKGTWEVDRTMLRGLKWEIPAAATNDKPVLLEFGVSPGQRDTTFATVKGRHFVWFLGSLFEVVKDEFVPRLLVGARRPNPKSWRDDNNDGRLQPEEVSALPHFWFMDAHLNLYRLNGVQWNHQGGGKTTKPYSIERVKFTGFNRKGGPTWAFDKIETVATDPDGGALPNSEFTVDDEGRVFTLVSGGSLQRGQRPQGSGHRVMAFDAKGRKMWEYHNVHCAFAWTSDAYTPGYMVGAFRMMCTSTKRLIGIPGYYGQYFLLDKETGLFVAALGQDQRSPYTMDHTMVLTENFNGTIWTHPRSGRTYFAGGDADCRIWELEGFEDFKVREGKVKVSAAQFAQSQKNADRARLAQKSAMGLLREFKLKKLANAATNGDYSEWVVVQPQTIVMSDKRSALAQLGYDDTHLWVRFQVNDESPLRNQASDFHNLFKTGDALDIQFCTDTATRPVHGQNQQEMRVGDARILITRTHGDKMTAAIIRYRTADKEKPKQHEYSSAVWKEAVDEVSELNDLPMHCKAEKDSYVVEVGIPWSVVGLKPAPGIKLRGDLGVIFGNEGGTKNAVRYMWSDKSPEVSINNDVPSEMRIHPNDMGTWVVE